MAGEVLLPPGTEEAPKEPAANGTPGNYLVIRAEFNPQTQHCEAKFDPAQVKDWDFAISLLQMAIADLKIKQKLSIQAQIQQAMAEQQKAQALANQVIGRGIRH